jgi:CHAD domain-containing protein
VLVLNVEDYLASTEGQLAGVEALLESWRIERARATDEAQSALGSARYQEFANAAKELMRSKNAGIFGKRTPRQPLYCVLPSMIWEHYQQLRALGLMPQPPTMPTLRTIRGQARDLYYLLAQYQSVLGSSGTTCMRFVQGLEESLTFYADLYRAISAASDYLKDSEEPAAGIRALIDTLKADRETWLERWPGLWKTITAPRFRRNLGRAVAEL